jgi:hypothetical protein
MRKQPAVKFIRKDKMFAKFRKGVFVSSQGGGGGRFNLVAQ